MTEQCESTLIWILHHLFMTHHGQLISTVELLTPGSMTETRLKMSINVVQGYSNEIFLLLKVFDRNTTINSINQLTMLYSYSFRHDIVISTLWKGTPIYNRVTNQRLSESRAICLKKILLKSMFELEYQLFYMAVILIGCRKEILAFQMLQR